MKEIKKPLILLVVTATIMTALLWLTLRMMPEWSLHNRVVLMACTGCGIIVPWFLLVARWKKSCKA